MNLKKVSVCLGLAAGSALAFSSAPAQAFSFNTGDNLGTCSGLLPVPGTLPSCTTGDGFGIIAKPDGYLLRSKTVNGVTGIGIQATNPVAPGDGFDAVRDEIDKGEFMHLIAPTSNTVLKDLGLAFLYRRAELGTPNFSDLINEIAYVDVFGAGGVDLGTGTLTVLDDGATALWEFGDIVQNVTGNFTGSGPGYANISNPFGNQGIEKLVLRVNQSQSDNFQQSDYGLVNASVDTSIPEPAALAGLGVVGAGLVLSRRRRPNKSN
ncbi:MAG TPA: hypothetical protein DD379_14710 [Cyanobacteria bacterium UBA11162]|nr:hypothetical protein [Cyanobacteria bacterium UBA11162]